MAVTTQAPNDTTTPDRIEQRVVLRSPRTRVWRTIDPAVGYSAEPTTLVEFKLEDVDGGTAVTIVESGFDRIPLARRSEAFRMDKQGWAGEIKNIERYVA